MYLCFLPAQVVPDCGVRAEKKAETTEEELLAAQQRLDGFAAESRVLQESSKAMRQECNEAWVSHAWHDLLVLHLLLASTA